MHARSPEPPSRWSDTITPPDANGAGQASARTIDLLTALWKRLLDQPVVLPDDDFFELGGDSMVAIALFAEIERQFGRALPITTIYDAPTVRRLGNLLEAAAAPAFSHTVLLKPGQGRHPLFMVHGIGGAIMELRRVAGFMDAQGPVYGIQAQGFDEAPPLDDLPTMVERYVDAIRAVAPTGPYFLAGYSFGGLLAMEIARKLRAAGDEIGLLILIDSYPAISLWPWFLRFDCKCRQAWQRLHILARGNLRDAFAYFALLLRGRDPETRRPFPVDPNLPQSIGQVQRAAEKALFAYRPSHYPGDVIFIAADEPSPSFPRHPRIMWQDLTGSLDVHGVHANHRGLVGEHADRLATTLSRLFDRYAGASKRRHRPAGADRVPL